METDPEGSPAMSVTQLQASANTAPAPVLTPAVVIASGLTRQYGEGDTAVHALRNVSSEIEEARLTAIMGPSGSGKSTLMQIRPSRTCETSMPLTAGGCFGTPTLRARGPLATYFWRRLPDSILRQYGIRRKLAQA
jgi:ABC-type molybdenum transport system ATPase subunit/photorepair protein PhrA